MRTRLWTWWDTATLAAYELVVIVIVLFVPGGSGSDSTPTWLMFAAAFAVTVPAALATRVLGAGNSEAWTMIAAGALIVSFRLTDRLWAARGGAAA